MIIITSDNVVRRTTEQERNQPRNRQRQGQRQERQPQRQQGNRPADQQPQTASEGQQRETQVHNTIIYSENEVNQQRICPVVVYNRPIDISPDLYNRLKGHYGEYLILQGPSGTTVTTQDYKELGQRFGINFVLSLA